MHHHRGCCPATLSPLVAIHHIGVILEGICLQHTAVKEPVNVSPQEVTSCSAIRLCLRSKHICIISRACSRATAASSHSCFEVSHNFRAIRRSGVLRGSSVCKGGISTGKKSVMRENGHESFSLPRLSLIVCISSRVCIARSLISRNLSAISCRDSTGSDG